MNHTEIGLQYGKLHALYETIIYLQKQIKIEQAKLEELKKQEGQANEVWKTKKQTNPMVR